MAYGMEVIFVLPTDALKRLVKEWGETPKGKELYGKAKPEDREFYWGPAPDDENDYLEWAYEAISAANDMVVEQLQQAQLELIREQFDPTAELKHSHGFPSIHANTPAGRREFSTFSIGLHGDEEGPQTMGISISSRYFPKWLDWRFEYGGSNDPVYFDAPTLEMMGKAKAALGAVIPELLDAAPAVVFQHY